MFAGFIVMAVVLAKSVYKAPLLALYILVPCVVGTLLGYALVWAQEELR